MIRACSLHDVMFIFKPCMSVRMGQNTHIKWHIGMIPIGYVERGRAYGRLEAVIDSKLGRRQQDIPIVHLVINKVPQSLFQNSVHALSLANSFMVVCSAHCLPDGQLRAKCTKENISELWIPISDEHLGPAMRLLYL